MGFGGVMPLVRRMVVEQRRWLDPAEFTDTLALCQLLPGPNVTNLAVMLGARYRGATGAAAAVSGLVAAPLVIVVSVASLVDRFGQTPLVAHALGGLGAVGSGLVLANAVKIAGPLRARRTGRLAGLAVAAAALVAVAGARIPLLTVLGVLAPASVALHAWMAATLPPGADRGCDG